MYHLWYDAICLCTEGTGHNLPFKLPGPPAEEEVKFFSGEDNTKARGNEVDQQETTGEGEVHSTSNNNTVEKQETCSGSAIKEEPQISPADVPNVAYLRSGNTLRRQGNASTTLQFSGWSGVVSMPVFP